MGEPQLGYHNLQEQMFQEWESQKNQVSALVSWTYSNPGTSTFLETDQNRETLERYHLL